MTNFDKYKQDLIQDKFIMSMVLNCDGCPVVSCGLDGGIAIGEECIYELEKWCNESSEKIVLI